MNRPRPFWVRLHAFMTDDTNTHTQQAPHQGAHFNVPDATAANGSSSNTRSKPGWRFCPCFSPYTLAVLAAIMGNVLEFYDFSIYG